MDKTKRLLTTLILGMGLVLALAWLASGGGAKEARAQGPTIRYVAPGADCGGASPCYGSVQAAVDAAQTGDEIRIAAGTYTDLHTTVVDGQTVAQVVLINKTVTVRGGYTTAEWTASDPVANATVLDAQGGGRVLYITGDPSAGSGQAVSPRVEGLYLTGGDAADGIGGGVYLRYTDATLSNNTIFGNTGYLGGGLFLDSGSGAALIGNTISNNTAHGGGGVYVSNYDATLSGNTISGNGADYGGGVFLDGSDATLGGNTISGNTAEDGGGLFLYNSQSTLRGNIILNNATQNAGGGVFLSFGSDATLVNNSITDNQAQVAGSGVYIVGSAPRLLHTTLARNGGDGSGVHITGSGRACSTVVLTNTILVNHTVAINVTGDNTVIVNGVLWFGNGVNTGGAGAIAVTNEYTGDPAFAPDGYHLTAGSAAIDQGVETWVYDDIDGDPRPVGTGYDFGADEHSTAKHWREVGLVSATAGGISDNSGDSVYPAVAIAPDGTPYIAWQDNSDEDAEVYVRRWNGSYWEEVGIGSASGGGISDNAGNSENPSVATAPDGTLYVAWEDDSSGNAEIYVLLWNGSAWEEVGTGSASGGGISDNGGSSRYPSIAVAPDGTPYVAWQDSSGGDDEIYLRRWDGSAWEEAGAGSASGGGISDNSGNSWYPTVAIAPDGTPYVVWHDHSSGDAEVYVRRWDGSEWAEVGAGSASGGGISDNSANSWAPVVAIAPDGTPYVVWHDHSSGYAEIYVRCWNGSAWEEVGAGSATGGGISDNSGDSKQPSLAIAPDGTPYVTWHDTSDGNYEIYIRRWNGTGWEEVGAGSASDGGISDNVSKSKDPAIAVAPDGRPYVVWYDNSDGDDEIYVRRWQ